MRILVANNLFFGAAENKSDELLLAMLEIIKDEHPEHDFLWLSNSKKTSGVEQNHFEVIVTGMSSGNRIAKTYWTHITLPGIIKKHRIDLLIAPLDGPTASLAIPQIFISDSIPAKKLTLKNMKERGVLIFSNKMRDYLTEHYPLVNEHAVQLPFASSATTIDIGPEEKASIIETYGNGKNFFVYDGSPNDNKNLLVLLKAFSKFKKRQKTDFKLLFLCRFSEEKKSFIHAIRSYKYRDDLIVLGEINSAERGRILASAYASIFPAQEIAFGNGVLEPMAHGIPTMIPSGSAMEEIAADAAIYFTAGDQDDIADKMMRLYKDETLKNALAIKGRNRASGFPLAAAATALWQEVERYSRLPIGKTQKQG